MAEFSIECPKCGTINLATTGLFAKKKIHCVFCNAEIDVKESRYIVKICPHCGKKTIYDQRKTGRESAYVCPSCHEQVSVVEAESVKRQLVTINCPSCNCAIEADRNDHSFPCPVCGKSFDAAAAYAKSKLVDGTGISVLQYEQDEGVLAFKHPIEDFNNGSQLIVHPSQEAVFFASGEMLDSFGAGRHTLTTENLPILKKLMPFEKGEQTPFHAEVYFVNQRELLGIKWGTDSRIHFIDPLTGIPMDIGARGTLSVQVDNSRKFLTTLVGTADRYSVSDIFAGDESGQRLDGQFKSLLLEVIKSQIAGIVSERRIDIFQIDRYLSELSAALLPKVNAEFARFGLAVRRFVINHVALPESEDFLRAKQLRSDRYLNIETENVEADRLEARRRVELAGLTTELEKEKIKAQIEQYKAQGEATHVTTQGMAEAQVMAAKQYSQQDVLRADVQKAYAEGLGNMNISGGGGVASDMIGLVAGMKVADMATRQLDNISPRIEQKRAGWKCACGKEDNTGKFCSECGSPQPVVWVCSQCGFQNTGKFCQNCGKKKEDS